MTLLEKLEPLALYYNFSERLYVTSLSSNPSSLNKSWMAGWLESQYFWWGISIRGIPLYNFMSGGMSKIKHKYLPNRSSVPLFWQNQFYTITLSLILILYDFTFLIFCNVSTKDLAFIFLFVEDKIFFVRCWFLSSIIHKYTFVLSISFMWIWYWAFHSCKV